MPKRLPRLPALTPKRAADPVANVRSGMAYLHDRIGPEYANILVRCASTARKPRVSIPQLREMITTLRAAEAVVRTLSRSRLALWPAHPASKTTADRLESLAEELERGTTHALAYDFDPLFESDGRLLYAFLAMKYAALCGHPLPSVTLLMAGSVAGKLELGTTERELRHEQWRKRRRVALPLFKDWASDFGSGLTFLKMCGDLKEGRLTPISDLATRINAHRWTWEELDRIDERDEAREARAAAREGKSRPQVVPAASPGGHLKSADQRRPVPLTARGPQDRPHDPSPPTRPAGRHPGSPSTSRK